MIAKIYIFAGDVINDTYLIIHTLENFTFVFAIYLVTPNILVLSIAEKYLALPYHNSYTQNVRHSISHLE